MTWYAGKSGPFSLKMQTKNQALEKLKQSKFRASFHLDKKNRAIVREKGMDKIKEDAADIIRKRLAPAFIPNDGKQTPYRAYPVFTAQHACACCCRGCLNKWYKVPMGTELTEVQQAKIVNLLMAWIEDEMKEDEEYGSMGNR
ncbi:MAG: DUF4186 domain-containing protein [Clostridia bacterium]|nr:DUF4186 domain-containing protein [Clostridia bacterium]